MKEMLSLKKTLRDKTLAFERQRILNLIDSKIKRKEMESAKGFAEELFKREIQFALIKRTRLLIRCNSALLKVIVVLLGVFFVFTALTVLNIRPLFSLIAEAIAIMGIVSAFVVDGILVKRLEKAVEMIMDVYETRRQSFIERALTCSAENVDPEDWLSFRGLTMSE